MQHSRGQGSILRFSLKEEKLIPTDVVYEHPLLLRNPDLAASDCDNRLRLQFLRKSVKQLLNDFQALTSRHVGQTDEAGVRLSFEKSQLAEICIYRDQYS